MSERRSTREIVVWTAGVVVAAGLIVLGPTYLVNSDLTANVLAAAKPADGLAAKPADDAVVPAAKPAETAVPPGAERAEEAASPAAKPAEDGALPATMPLGADPKFASVADMPA